MSEHNNTCACGPCENARLRLKEMDAERERLLRSKGLGVEPRQQEPDTTTRDAGAGDVRRGE